MLINLSNHPLCNWTPEQKALAEERYSTIIDMPFPAIDPYANEASLKEFAQTYIDNILAMKPSAVHIMGELTFTFYLVKQLHAKGICCIASTTARIVTEKDHLTKTTTFQFASFRPYF